MLNDIDIRFINIVEFLFGFFLGGGATDISV